VDWWSYVQGIDAVTNRALFTVDNFFRAVRDRDGRITADTLAIGIELERTTVERMFPAVVPASRRGGGRPPDYLWPEWKQALDDWLKDHPRAGGLGYQCAHDLAMHTR
jgi:hypothetical protein